MEDITLCCGHKVNSTDEAVGLMVPENGGRSYGLYCKECADDLVKTAGAKVYDYPEDWTRFAGCKPNNYTGELPQEETDELVELIRAIRNRCDIFLALYSVPNSKKWWATLLEDLCEDSQDVLKFYCIDK